MPQAGWLHFLDEPGPVSRRVQKIALEPVDILQAQLHADFVRVLGDFPHALDAPLPLVLRHPLAAELAKRRVKRPSHRLAAQSGAAIQISLVRLDARLANRSIRTDHVLRRAADRRPRADQPQLVEPLAPLFVIRHVVQIEHGHFDNVEANRLHPVQEGQSGIVERIGPHQQVESKLHCIFSFGNRGMADTAWARWHPLPGSAQARSKTQNPIVKAQTAELRVPAPRAGPCSLLAIGN